MVVKSKSKGRKRAPSKKKAVLTKETTGQNAKIMAKEWQGMDEKMYKKELAEISEEVAYHDLSVEQVALAMWLALPSSERGTQDEFCERWKISRVTLWKWSNNPTLKRLRFDMMKAFVFHHTPDVLDNLRRAAMISPIIGNPTPAIKLWLQYLEDYRETQQLETKGHITIQFGFGQSKFMQPIDSQPAKIVPAKKNAKN